MKRRMIASLFITAMVVSMLVSGCGNNNKENNTEKNSEIITESETESEKVSEGTESEKETQVSTNDSETEVSESEKVEENKEETKPSHTCEFTTLKNDSNNHWYECSCGATANSGSHNYDNDSDASCNTCGYTRDVHTCNFSTLKTDENNHWYACSCGKTANSGAHSYDDDYDASCNDCGYTRSVPERPEENTTPIANVDWNGGNIHLESINIDIPTMTEFNRKGLESTDGNWWWTGPEGDKQALSSMNQIYKTCDEFFAGMVNKGWGSQGSNAFSVTRNTIWFSYTDGNIHNFKLTRDAANGYYILEINKSLKYDDFYGVDISCYNRDVVKTLISFVSSEVSTVFNYLYNGMYGTGTAFNTGIYESVGDCQIKLDKYFYENENGTHIKFYIKPN